jgi:hypothetical protein
VVDFFVYVCCLGGDLDAATKNVIDKGARNLEILKQPQFAPYSVEKQVAITNLSEIDLHQVDVLRKEFKSNHIKNHRQLAEINAIKKVVLGGCWNCYFLHETKIINSTDKGLNYYFKDGEKRESFRRGSGSDMAIAELEQFLKFLSQKHEVYLLLDNPFGEPYNPRNLIGNRLVFKGEQHLKEMIQVEDAQAELNERLKKIAQQAGVNVIDQLAALCPEKQCLRLTTDKKPIYKDSHHLRPFFVKEQGSYLEQQLLMKKF